MPDCATALCQAIAARTARAPHAGIAKRRVDARVDILRLRISARRIRHAHFGKCLGSLPLARSMGAKLARPRHSPLYMSVAAPRARMSASEVRLDPSKDFFEEKSISCATADAKA